MSLVFLLFSNPLAASDGAISVKYIAIEGPEEPGVPFGYSNAAGDMQWILPSFSDLVYIRSGLSYPNFKDHFEVTVRVRVTKEAVVVDGSQFVPRFINTVLWINPEAKVVDFAGKLYYLVDSLPVPYGWQKFLWKRDYVDARSLFLSQEGERVINGERYLELGGQQNYYAASSGLLVLIVYDYTLIDPSSGTRARTAGKLIATESSADHFPWKTNIRHLGVLIILTILALATLARVTKRKAVRANRSSPTS